MLDGNACELKLILKRRNKAWAERLIPDLMLRAIDVCLSILVAEPKKQHPATISAACFLFQQFISCYEQPFQLVFNHLTVDKAMGKEVQPKSSSNGGISLQKTSKFAVLDIVGITQPAPVKNVTPSSSAEVIADANPSQSSSAVSSKEGTQGRRAKASTGPRMETDNYIGGDSFTGRTVKPVWINTRQTTYEKILIRRNEELTQKTPVEIFVTLPDGTVLRHYKKSGTDEDTSKQPFLAWKTSPYDVAVAISQGLADNAVVARVTYASYVSDYDLAEDGMTGEDLLITEDSDGSMSKSGEGEVTSIKPVLWDMTRPLVGNVAKMEFLKFESDADAKTVFWHSSAHMLGEALEHLYGCRLTIGPPLKGGFYYDSYMGISDSFKEDDCKLLSSF